MGNSASRYIVAFNLDRKQWYKTSYRLTNGYDQLNAIDRVLRHAPTWKSSECIYYKITTQSLGAVSVFLNDISDMRSKKVIVYYQDKQRLDILEGMRTVISLSDYTKIPVIDE